MKKLVLPFAFLFCVAGLKAQSNTNNAQSKPVGQFQWKRTAQDSVNIERLPFVGGFIILLESDKAGQYKAMLKGAMYAVWPDEAAVKKGK